MQSSYSAVFTWIKLVWSESWRFFVFGTITLTLKVGLSGFRGSDEGHRPAAISLQIPWHLLSWHIHQASSSHLLGSRKLQCSSLSDSFLANMFSNIPDTGQFLCVKRENQEKQPNSKPKTNFLLPWIQMKLLWLVCKAVYFFPGGWVKPSKSASNSYTFFPDCTLIFFFPTPGQFIILFWLLWLSNIYISIICL